MPALPQGVIDASLETEAERNDQSLSAQIQQQVAPVMQQVQAIRVPDLGSLLGFGQAASPEPAVSAPAGNADGISTFAPTETPPQQQQQQQQGFALPSLRALLNPEPPKPTQSGTPAAMPSNAGAINSSTITTGDQSPALRPGESVGSVTLAGGNFTPEETAAIQQAAQEEGVPADMIAAIWDTEQSGATQVSDAGARGRGQVVPGQGYDLPGEDPTIPLVAARQTARALKDKARIAGGDWDEAGAAYFGYGVDSGGMDTDTYRERVRQNRAKYQQGAPQAQQQRTGPMPEDAPNGGRQTAFSAGSYTPNQINAATSEGLDYETALAVCGPAAAIAFARKNGRNPTMQEAVGLAREVGWTVENGMAGPASQQRLLQRMGVAARLNEGTPDWKMVAADVQRGNPVTISTPGHYFVAERYDPESGAFDFGESAAVLKASGGRRWFRPEELAGLGMGEARATLFIDNPESPTPSVAAAPAQGAARPASADPIPYKPQTGQKLRVRDQWGNEFEMTQEELNTRPGGARDLTVIGRVALNAGSGLPAPESAPAVASSAPPPAGNGSELWSPDSGPETAPGAFQASTGRSGGPGVMYRGPLGAAPAEVGNDEPSTSTYQDPDTLTYPAPPTYNDPDAGGTISTPIPSNSAPIQPQSSPNVEIVDGRTTPPTPGGDWQPVQTVPNPQRPPAMDPGQFLAEDSQSTPPQSVADLNQSRQIAPPPMRQGPQEPPQASYVPRGMPDGPMPDRPSFDPLSELEKYGEPGRKLAAELRRAAADPSQSVNPWTVYEAIQAIPFEVVARARREMISDAEAKRAAGTDPVAPFRPTAEALGLPLPSPEELNPEGRPASDIGIAAGLTAIAPDPFDPAANAALGVAGRGIAATARGARAGARVFGEAVEPVAEAAGRAFSPGPAARALPEGEMQLGSGFVPEGQRPRWGDVLEQQAVERFGLTDSPRETGYLMRDGSGLDLSGKADGKPEQVRSIAHSAVGQLTNRDGRRAVTNFMQETGAVRFTSNGNTVTAEIPQSMSPAQKTRFMEEARYADLAMVDITDPVTGKTVASETFRMPQDRGRLNQMIRGLPDHSFDGEPPARAQGAGFIPRLSDAQNAAQGGVIGAASEIANDEELSPQERLARIGAGAALGVAAGRTARGRAGQRLGSGMVPDGPRPRRALETPTTELNYQGRTLAVEATGDPAAPFILRGGRGGELALVPMGSETGTGYYVKSPSGSYGNGAVVQLIDNSLLWVPNSGPHAPAAQRAWRADLKQRREMDVARGMNSAAPAALGAGAGTELDEEGNPIGYDPWKGITGAMIAGVLGRRGMSAAERDAWVKATKAAAARGNKGAAEQIAKVERVAAQQGLPGFEHIDPMTDPASIARQLEPATPGQIAARERAARAAGMTVEEYAAQAGERVSQQSGPMLPGMDRIDPLTDPVPNRPAGEGILLPIRDHQDMRGLVEHVIRAEQEQARRLAVRGTAPDADVEIPGLAPNRSALQRINTSINEAVAPFQRRLDIVRYASMLSDTALQFMNAGGSALMAAADVAATPIAAGIDAARSAVRGTPREVFMSEVPARLAGMRAGATIGLENAAQILRTGLRPEDVSKLDNQSRGFGTNIPGIAPAGSRRAAAVDAAFEAPLRGLAAADAVFRTMAQGGHLAAEAQAAARVANGGKPASLQVVREAMKDPALIERVNELAARSVLQEDRAVTRWWRETMSSPQLPAVARAVAQVEMPFVKTPYNIVAQGVGMSPVALAGVVKDIADGKAPREIAYRVARVALGTAVMGVAVADYAAGNLTGPRPTDQKEASTLPPGWQPWSRKITNPVNGDTYYVPLAYLGPFALPPVMAILAGESAKKGDLSPAWAAQVALGVGQYAAQNSFFQGVANIGSLVDHRNADKNWERNAEQVVSQFSPHVVGGGALGREIQRIMGMPMRDPQGAMQALMATHPLTADQVPARQDVLGRPVVQTDMGVGAAVIRGTKERDAGVIRAFRRAKEGLPIAPPKQITDPITKEQKALSVSQQKRWQRAFGAALREGWDSNGNPTEAKVLQEIERAARTAANETVLGMR